MKCCSACGLLKDVSEYSVRVLNKDGLQGQCKICIASKSYARSVKNRDRINFLRRQRRKTNKDYFKNKRKLYYKKYKEKELLYNKQYYVKRKEKDLNFKLRSILRNRINKIVRRELRSGSSVSDLGCSIAELKRWLESKFQKGMTWDNYGKNGWHIDHVKPLVLFDLTDRRQFLEACNYTNLQPLWWFENLTKGTQYEEDR